MTVEGLAPGGNVQKRFQRYLQREVREESSWGGGDGRVLRCGRNGSRRFPLATRALALQARIMQSHELLRDVLDDHNPKEVAAELGLSLSMVYKWAEPSESPGSGAPNPLDRVEALIRCTKDPRIAKWICERAGGFFILNPKAHWSHPLYLVPATNRIVQEFADLLSVIATAASDNQVSRKEAQAIRSRWEELKSVTEGFVRCCEEGNFSTMQRTPVDGGVPAKPAG